MSVLTREGFHALTAQAKRDLQRSTDSVNVMVCAGTGCIAGGAMKVYEYLKSACERRGIPVAVSLRQEAGAKGIHLKKSGCHGFCEIGPLVHTRAAGHTIQTIFLQMLSLPGRRNLLRTTNLMS